MKQAIKWRLKKIVLLAICLGFLTFMPSLGHATSVILDGTAFIDWNQITITFSPVGAAPVVPSWNYQGSFSGTYVTLNGTFTPPDFEAQATAIGSATIPEPGTLFLLGSGLISLAAILRRRFKKARR